MKSPFRVLHSRAILRGDICTIRLKMIVQSGQETEAQLRVSFRELQSRMESLLRVSILESLGSAFEIRELCFIDDNFEVLIKIATTSYVMASFDGFTKTLKLLVSNLSTSLAWMFETQLTQVQFLGQWRAEPPLIRLQLEASNERSSFTKKLQQPLVVLLVGTILGSIVIPYLTDLGNRRRLRHEERIKIALMIIEQSGETDRRLSNLMDYLVLFRKDHDDPSLPKVNLKKDQLNARKTIDEMYLSFNAQAWWWHWNVKSKSDLSSLATPAESRKVALLAREYSNDLLQCTQAINELWGPFLKQPYEPANPRNDVLIVQAGKNLTTARIQRNKVALEMAKVFASK